MTGYSITTLRAPFFRWHAVITLTGGRVVTMDPTFGRRRAQELAKRYADGFVEFRVNVELGPKASSSDDVRDSVLEAIEVANCGGVICSTEPVVIGEATCTRPFNPAMEEIFSIHRNNDRLRAAINDFLNAFYACGMTIMGDFPESEFDALRKAVGR